MLVQFLLLVLHVVLVLLVLVQFLLLVLHVLVLVQLQLVLVQLQLVQPATCQPVLLAPQPVRPALSHALLALWPLHRLSQLVASLTGGTFVFSEQLLSRAVVEG